jgi:hypothetical protein
MFYIYKILVAFGCWKWCPLYYTRIQKHTASLYSMTTALAQVELINFFNTMKKHFIKKELA